MAELIADCPRCGSRKITFDLKTLHSVGWLGNRLMDYEGFCVCRNCNTSAVFHLREKEFMEKPLLNQVMEGKLQLTLNRFLENRGVVTTFSGGVACAPELVPEHIQRVFVEGSICISVKCFNAAGTMFRLCIDMTTRDLLDRPESQATPSVKKYGLKQKLKWMFENKVLPIDLEDLSDSVREDGNDGAHAGTLTEVDAEELKEFTTFLLERIYAEPERLRLNKERRAKRRDGD